MLWHRRIAKFYVLYESYLKRGSRFQKFLRLVQLFWFPNSQTMSWWEVMNKKIVGGKKFQYAEISTLLTATPKYSWNTQRGDLLSISSFYIVGSGWIQNRNAKVHINLLPYSTAVNLKEGGGKKGFWLSTWRTLKKKCHHQYRCIHVIQPLKER